jgi:Cof subfamily protein (haloacid dehalogenase superfamily)
MIKLIVTDLDGTLLDVDKSISDANRQALDAAERHHFDICFASGRMYPEIQRIMDDLGRTYHAISQNGSFVHTKDRKLLKSSSFEPELARELFRISNLYGVAQFIFCVDQTIYTPVKTDIYAKYEARIFAPCTEVEGCIEDEIGRRIIPSKFTFYGEIGELTALQEEVTDLFPGRINAEISDSDCLDVMPGCTSKGKSLMSLLDEINLSPEEVACFGNSFNDVSMFDKTPHSFAMSHSHSAVKDRANYIVDSVSQGIKWVMDYNGIHAVYNRS